MSSPSSRCGEVTTWKGPSTVDSVVPAGVRLLMASTSIDTPITSESRMNSWRFSSHIAPTAVRKPIAASHSAWVGSTSRTNPCRWRVNDARISRRRGSSVRAKLSMTASVAVSSVKSPVIVRR